MRFVSFRAGTTSSFGALKDDGLVDVGKLLGVPTLGAALRAGLLPRALELGAAATELALDEIRSSRPCPTPRS